ncbi:MAG: AI-2E family transporter [Acidobacteriota bacterium]
MADVRQTEHDRFVVVLFYAVVLLVGYLGFRIFSPFLAPLVWAAVFAMVLNPVQEGLARRMGLNASAAVTTVLAAVMLVGPAVGLLFVLVREVGIAVQSVQAGGFEIPAPDTIRDIWTAVRSQSPIPLPEDLGTALGAAVQEAATFIAGKAGALVQNVAGFVFGLFVMLFGLFYFLRDNDRIVGAIRRLLPFEEERRERIIRQTYDLVVATIGSTFAVAIVQGTLTGLALGVLGFRAPVFWGVMTAGLSLIPAVGSGLVWGPAALYLFATGSYVKGAILLAFGIGVIGMADNVLRPVLLAGRTTMHGLLVFISLLGGMAAFGFIGLVIGPVVVAAFETLLQAATRPDVTLVAAAAEPATPVADDTDVTGSRQ